MVYADMEELPALRAHNRERIERERDYPMIKPEVSNVAEPRRKRTQGWHNK